jgi:kynureninase
VSDPLLSHRERFPVLARTNYLISNSLGAMPIGVRDSLDRYADRWATRGVRAWAEEWWMLPMEVGDLVGSLINAGPREVSMHLNVTLAAATVLSCFDWRAERNVVLATDMNFPSLLYLYQQHQREGLVVRQVESRDGIGVPSEQLIASIDERVRLVALDHVLFRSAYVQDAKAIIAAAHERGALVLLDAFQSIGTVPVDVQDLDADFVAGGCLKWLCGGPGACFLWVRPDLAQELEPRLAGWMAHVDPFAFDPQGLKRRHDAYRFTTGTPNIPGLLAARPGLEIVAEIGPRAIRAKSERQTARLVALAQERGWRVTCPLDPARRGGTVAIDVPEGKAVCQELLARDVIVDYRPKAGVRVSPHFYNTDDELDACVAEIEDVLRTGAWRRHADALPRYG